MIRALQHKFALLCRTVRLKLQFYRNVSFMGIENISLSTKIYGREKGTITLGKSITTEKNTVLVSVGGKLTIGDNSFFGDSSRVVCHNSIRIGKQCMFGPMSVVYDHDHLFGQYGVMKEKFISKPIIIEDNCLIGANAVILKGTHIGEGCVIGAGTVVRGKIPAHSIVTSDRTLTIRPIENAASISS